MKQMIALWGIMAVSLGAAQEPVRIQISTTMLSQKKMPILLVLADNALLTGAACSEREAVIEVFKRDLQASGQCIVTIEKASMPCFKHDVETLYKKGYPFVIYLSFNSAMNMVEGRLYNALDVLMLEGKKWQRRQDLSTWAHAIAHDVWHQLMGVTSSFTSKIAYIKRMKSKKRNSSQLCIIDWDGEHEQAVVTNPTIKVAPCWSADGQLLFFSEFTQTNVRLMATDLQGLAWVVVDQAGTTVGVSGLKGGLNVIYCRSGAIWQCSYDPIKKKSSHQLLIQDNGLCASPTLLPQGDVIYCSSGKIKRWNQADRTTQVLTDTGYCVGPAYHAATGRLVYSQRIGKYMQLMIYDENTKKSQQLTTTAGDKIDPCWSPCGMYIAYCLEQGSNSVIELFNTVTGTSRRLSPAGSVCSGPSWSLAKS